MQSGVPGSWSRRIFFGLLISGCLALRGVQVTAQQADEGPARSAAARPIVTIVIDYSDGVQKHFTAIPWRKGMTVLAAMEAAQRHPRGIRFEYRGSGDVAFLTKLDDLENEGDGKNWMYQVNGKSAPRSFGACELSAGDSVLWKFK